MYLLDNLIGLIAPHRCLGCGYAGRLLCPGCLAKLPPGPRLVPSGSTPSQIRAATIYEGLAKDLLWKLKSDGARAAAKVMAGRMASLMPMDAKLLVVPVPTASSRVRQRGYDQAKLIARCVARSKGVPYADCLIRLGQGHQVGASRNQRLKQMGGSLKARKSSKIAGSHILLVDDVTTTGATLESAAKILMSAGAAQVEALIFAYAQRKN